MADYKQYLGMKSVPEIKNVTGEEDKPGKLHILPSVSVEGLDATSSMTRVGVSKTQFVCTLGNGSHELIAKIRISLSTSKSKVTKIVDKVSDGK